MNIDNLKYFGPLAFSLLLLSSGTTSCVSAAAVVGTVQAFREAREQEAMEYFRTLLTAPIKQLPTWQQFVDTITPMLEGTRFHTLGESLRSLRDKRGSLGKGAIAWELSKFLDVLPADIAAKIQNMDRDELSRRVKC